MNGEKSHKIGMPYGMPTGIKGKTNKKKKSEQLTLTCNHFVTSK